MIVLGAGALGCEPVAGHEFLDDPTVTVDSLGSVTSGGPNVPVSWVFSLVQHWYRVRILNTGDPIFDTGRRYKSAGSHVVDWDAEVLPSQASGLEAEVTAGHTFWHVTYQGVDTVSFDVDFGDPQCSIVRPGEVVTATEDLEVEWLFSDDPGHTQAAFRVTLDTMSGIRLWDTGWVEGSATSYTLPLVLTPGSSYRLGVQLKNDQGMRSE
ncbi:MAG TPA: hypothetical protein VF377_08860 [Acidimicrobiia bacterium]